MSDPDTAPDPMDKAYARAEDLLADQAAREARRARVLAAVARTAAEAPPAPPAPVRKRWLVAASVAGVSLLLATKVYLFPPINSPVPPTTAAAVASDAGASRPPSAAPSEPEPAVAAKAPARASAAKPEAPALASAPTEVAPFSPLPPMATPSQAGPVAAAPQASRSGSNLDEVVVSAARAKSASGDAQSEASAASSAGMARKLRDAALLGRIDEVETLLSAGAPVDEPDEDGETALMKSVQGRHTAIASMLLRRGASLDRANASGVSARDMAAAIANAGLNRALNLER